MNVLRLHSVFADKPRASQVAREFLDHMFAGRASYAQALAAPGFTVFGETLPADDWADAFSARMGILDLRFEALHEAPHYAVRAMISGPFDTSGFFFVATLSGSSPTDHRSCAIALLIGEDETGAPRVRRVFDSLLAI